MNSRLKVFLLIWSQVGWFGCVYLAKLDLSPLSILIPLVSWMVLFFSKTLKLKNYLVLVLMATLGIIFDTILFKFGWIQFNSNNQFEQLGVVPTWLISMWFLFVSILPQLSVIFSDRKLIAIVAGLILGPLTYKSGEAFEVLFLKDYKVILVYALFWGLYFPLSLIYFSRLRKIDNSK